MIRSSLPVPIQTARRVPPAGGAASSNDHTPQQERALVIVPTPRDRKPRQKTARRARNAAAEVVVQIIAGPQRRGLKAETSELARYRTAYAQAAQTKTPPPVWERRA
jgi:hypothetical protein